MLVEVSIGEVVDKYSILELKLEKIRDSVKTQEINKELEALSLCKEYIEKLPFYYKLLKWVNQQIWEKTDQVKALKPTDAEFPQLSHDIFEFNQKRFRLKKLFNTSLDSSLKEQKSYAETHCVIHISNENVFFSKLAEINSIMLDYDAISIDYATQSPPPVLSKLYSLPSIEQRPATEASVHLHLEDYSIPSSHRAVFELNLEPIYYFSAGRLGDMIHQLSVIYENFRETGRKGILYITDQIEKFQMGVEKTYHDTYEIIRQQIYIEDYKMYYPGLQLPPVVNLSQWRSSQLLYKANWNVIFKSEYNVEWGIRPWLRMPVLEEWKDRVVISCSFERLPTANFHNLYEIYKDKLVYVGQSITEYQRFEERVGVKIKNHVVKNLSEYVSIIQSCSIYIGNLSSPMAFAFAFHKKAIVMLDHKLIDNIHVLNLPVLQEKQTFV